jgi:hypothetical protein
MWSMFRAVSLSLSVFFATACAGSTAVDDETSWSTGGSSGAAAGGGPGALDASSWPAGGSSGNGSSGNGAGIAGGGAAASGKPYYLHGGRTYDQESDYIEWDGQVSFVTLKHKDQTSLPPDEGGASCSGGCDEQVTRIEAGASIWGRFMGFTGINMQLASTDEVGVGQGVFSVCNSDLPAFDVAAASTGLPGFNNLPSPAHAVSPSDDCEWRVKAIGGFVYFRAVTVTSPDGSGGSGGGGTGGGAGTGAGPA